MTLKPIQTRYKGHHFRSRLEARWAVALDELGVRWMYEHEGFDLGQFGYYLPDFWLPDLNTFLEVKPTDPTPEESWKLTGLAKERNSFAAWGFPFDGPKPVSHYNPWFYSAPPGDNGGSDPWEGTRGPSPWQKVAPSYAGNLPRLIPIADVRICPVCGWDFVHVSKSYECKDRVIAEMWGSVCGHSWKLLMDHAGGGAIGSERIG